jgi:hypothetical protein
MLGKTMGPRAVAQESDMAERRPAIDLVAVSAALICLLPAG